MKAKDERSRNWTFIGYPGDSLPDKYFDILDEMHIQWCESPVHDKDTNLDGELKKAHIHFLVCFEGNKSYSQIEEICNAINATCPKKVSSVRGMVRYFVHADNPEKYQYEKAAIKPHGGIEIESYFAPSAEAKKRFLEEMTDWCEQTHCNELRVLMNYAKRKKKETWWDCLTVGGGLYFMNLFLTSKRNMEQLEEKAEQDDNKKTTNDRNDCGEV